MANPYDPERGTGDPPATVPPGTAVPGMRETGWGKTINDLYKSFYGGDASDNEIWAVSDAMGKENLSVDQIGQLIKSNYETAHAAPAPAPTPGTTPGGTAPGTGTTTPGGTTIAPRNEAASYAPTAFTGDTSTGYGKWLAELAGRTDLGNEAITKLPEADQLQWLLSQTHAGQYLSPYYRKVLEDQLARARAGYNVQAALGGTDMPTQAGTGADETFAQYLQDQLVGLGNRGQGAVGWGAYSGTTPDTNAFLDRVMAGQSAAAGTPEADLWTKYNEDRSMLTNIAAANLRGPWADYRRRQLEEARLADAATPDPGAFVTALRDWQRRTYPTAARA